MPIPGISGSNTQKQDVAQQAQTTFGGVNLSGPTVYQNSPGAGGGGWVMWIVGGAVALVLGIFFFRRKP